MGIVTLLLLSVGLAMDAFAVSITNGLVYRKKGIHYAVYSAIAFGVFQGLMPIIGFFAGRTFSELISYADHWIALVLLGFIGGKMIYESLRPHPQEEQMQSFSVRLMVMQAVATSIDALAVGVSFAMIKVNIWLAALTIAAITFLVCLVGVLVGDRFGKLVQNKAEIFGGVILIGIGLKIFIEHSFFG